MIQITIKIRLMLSKELGYKGVTQLELGQEQMIENKI